MHNNKTRRTSTKKTIARDGTKRKVFDGFIGLMRLEDDESSKSYENNKDEKLGRILLMIVLVLSVILSTVPIILAILHNLISNKFVF